MLLRPGWNGGNHTDIVMATCPLPGFRWKNAFFCRLLIIFLLVCHVIWPFIEHFHNVQATAHQRQRFVAVPYISFLISSFLVDSDWFWVFVWIPNRTLNQDSKFDDPKFNVESGKAKCQLIVSSNHITYQMQWWIDECAFHFRLDPCSLNEVQNK